MPHLPGDNTWLDRHMKRLPLPLQLPWIGWKWFSYGLGRMMSWIILTLLWLVGFGAYGMVLHIVRFLRLEPERRASAWLEVAPNAPDTYRRQF